MASITLQVVDGFEKGKIYSQLPTPVSIGREEDNTIQLNDERVSRFHLKIQEDGGRFILMDLDSTNGTRVNGHPVSMRVLQVGDQVGIGRSLLVFGTPEQIAARFQSSQARPAGSADPSPGGATIEISAPLDPNELNPELVEQFQAAGPTATGSVDLFPHGPPELPSALRPVQLAQLSDLLAFLHEQISRVCHAAVEETRGEIVTMQVDGLTWQRLLNLNLALAQYLRSLSEPNPSGD